MIEQTLSINDVANVVKYSSNFSMMGDKYICCRLNDYGELVPKLMVPIRFKGMILILCRRGYFDVEINLQNYHVGPNHLVVINPDFLTKFSNMDYTNLDVSVLFIDTAFLSDVNIDLNAINVRSLIQKRNPMVELTEVEVSLFTKHLELLEMHADNDTHTVFSRNIARSLIAATAYRLLQFNFDRLNDLEAPVATSSRRSTYVHDFMRLVHLNYTQHRSVAFYASKLFISPKYLSLVVKETTGRSAAEWINEFVILEAKNLLRFSGKNVQQVAYALNFTNQSSFGKYFKHITGQSPSQYQKS